MRRAVLLASFAGVVVGMLLSASPAAEITTGALVGTVTDDRRVPLPDASVSMVSPSGRYHARTDAHGSFALFGITPDAYTISVERTGYAAVLQRDVIVHAGAPERLAFALTAIAQTIGRTTGIAPPFTLGAAADTFVVSGADAQARAPVAAAAGLGSFLQGTVQGAIARAPGIGFDPLGNVSSRGGKVDDTVFTYDSVPIPQGLVVQPGGNFVGAQTPTTGVGETQVTLGGYGVESENALGGVVNQIPLVGTFPTQTSVELGTGIGTRWHDAAFQLRTATPDLRSRLAFSARASSQDIAYGDGHTFYPGEASVVGIGLQARGQYSAALTYHWAASPRDDLSFTAFNGAASYDQYGSPFPGQTYGLLNGDDSVFPGVANQHGPVTSPSRTRGFFNVMKLGWQRTGDHSVTRLQLYQSFFAAKANGPFWDDNAFGEGAISLVSSNAGHLTGVQFDANVVHDRQTISYGVEHRIDTSLLDEFVPTDDEVIHSNPTLQTTYAYLGSTWQATERLAVSATARAFSTHVLPASGFAYTVGALDPHVGAAYRIGDRLSLRATFDHTTVPPKPLETDRTDTINVLANGRPAPFVPLVPERGDDLSISLQSTGRTRARVTYFLKSEHDRIDAIPPDLKTAVQNGVTPGSAGVPGNVGDLRAHGFELYAERGPLTLTANAVHAYSSSGSQFSYTGLNTAALLAGHLFPVSYLPQFSATLAYAFGLGSRWRVTPSVSYESGYPYGVGRKIWIVDPADGSTPIAVNNDNHVDPGANYYFLRDPARPYEASTNPYIATLGTPEGDDPNALHAPPQTLVNVHIEGDIAPRVSLVVDVGNLFGTATPTQLISNPYLVGPPGYSGGNPMWAAYYGDAGGYDRPYTLGNGIPTNDGRHAILPWSFGTGGYVGASWPTARSVQVRLQYRL